MEIDFSVNILENLSKTKVLFQWIVLSFRGWYITTTKETISLDWFHCPTDPVVSGILCVRLHGLCVFFSAGDQRPLMHWYVYWNGDRVHQDFFFGLGQLSLVTPTSFLSSVLRESRSVLWSSSHAVSFCVVLTLKVLVSFTFTETCPLFTTWQNHWTLSRRLVLCWSLTKCPAISKNISSLLFCLCSWILPLCVCYATFNL